MLTGETVHFCHSQDWPVTNSRGGPSLSSLENRCLTETLQKLCHCPGSPGVDISTKGNERALDTGGQLCCWKFPLPSDGKLPLLPPTRCPHFTPPAIQELASRLLLLAPCPCRATASQPSGLLHPARLEQGWEGRGVTPPTRSFSEVCVFYNSVVPLLLLYMFVLCDPHNYPFID